MDQEMVTHTGGCHCGAVRFEVDAPPGLQAYECNCSICAMTGFVHLIVPQRDFRLLGGADALSEYRFNTGTARHLFCRRCGIKSFYVPRSNPDGFSINVRCLQPSSLASVTVQTFDGRNWEQAAGALEHLSR
ncbi:MAG: GFA family protein [Gammaproteobacteria bacterium]